MILRPLQPPFPASAEFIPAWEAVERTQTEKYEGCWLISQPSHAVLAAEIAARISIPAFPVATPQILEAIALHDAGWGIPDAQAIMKSRSVRAHRPESFVAATAAQFREAWESSIETCQALSPAGGYIVSRHFYRLAEFRVAPGLVQDKADRQRLESFLAAEERRQKKLAGKQSMSIEQLEQFTDLLQFCDLFSLYVCSGAPESVEFPEYFGIKLRVANKPEGYGLEPPVLEPGVQFEVAALRHPASKEVSSREIKIQIG